MVMSSYKRNGLQPTLIASGVCLSFFFLERKPGNPSNAVSAATSLAFLCLLTGWQCPVDLKSGWIHQAPLCFHRTYSCGFLLPIPFSQASNPHSLGPNSWHFKWFVSNCYNVIAVQLLALCAFGDSWLLKSSALPRNLKTLGWLHFLAEDFYPRSLFFFQLESMGICQHWGSFLPILWSLENCQPFFLLANVYAAFGKLLLKEELGVAQWLSVQRWPLWTTEVICCLYRLLDLPPVLLLSEWGWGTGGVGDGEGVCTVPPFHSSLSSLPPSLLFSLLLIPFFPLSLFSFFAFSFLFPSFLLLFSLFLIVFLRGLMDAWQVALPLSP